MNTFLFAWNPKKWPWTSLKQHIDRIKHTGHTTEIWSVKSHKKVQPGDRAFLIRLGQKPKGIMASGFVQTAPFLSLHWSGEDKLVPRVEIEFEIILDPDNDPLLGIDLLKQGKLTEVDWTPQASGISIDASLANELEALWFDFLTAQHQNDNRIIQSNVSDQTTYSEAQASQVLLTKYERNPYARKACIDHYGFTCLACEFDFEKTYGELGKNFIHVHHVRPLAIVEKKNKIDPISDLRPVCPNCHAMIHKRKNPYTIEEIKAIMRRHRGDPGLGSKTNNI